MLPLLLRLTRDLSRQNSIGSPAASTALSIDHLTLALTMEIGGSKSNVLCAGERTSIDVGTMPAAIGV
jgi:hypothetical protein